MQHHSLFYCKTFYSGHPKKAQTHYKEKKMDERKDEEQYYQTKAMISPQKNKRDAEIVFLLLLPIAMMLALLFIICISSLFVDGQRQLMQQTVTTVSFDINNITTKAKLTLHVFQSGKASGAQWLMNMFRSAHVNNNGYTDIVILFIHGFPLSAVDTWSDVVSELQQQYTCVFPNMRGFDSSLIHPLMYNRDLDMFTMKEQLALDIKHLVDDVLRKSGKSKVLIVGHDLGGTAAFTFASLFGKLYENKVLGVIGINAPYQTAWNIVLEQSSDTREKSKYIRRLLDQQKIIAANELWDLMFNSEMGYIQSKKNRLISQWKHGPTLSYMLNWYNALFNYTGPLDDQLEDINTWFKQTSVVGSESPMTIRDQLPILAIGGGADPFLPIPSDFVSQFDIMQTLIDNFWTHLVQNGSHFLPVDNSKTVATLIRTFINKIN